MPAAVSLRAGFNDEPSFADNPQPRKPVLSRLETAVMEFPPKDTGFESRFSVSTLSFQVTEHRLSPPFIGCLEMRDAS